VLSNLALVVLLLSIASELRSFVCFCLLVVKELLDLQSTSDIGLYDHVPRIG